MKIVASSWLLAALLLGLAERALSATKMPAALLVDMYAVREGDQYVVHVLASGDITRFLSDRKLDRGTYRLTLDVPALSPTSTKFDVATPFSRRFQVWPMMLGKRVYSRIEIELDLGASSVVGLQNSSHLFVRIHKELPPMQVAEAAAPPAPARPACEPVEVVPEVTATPAPPAMVAAASVPDLPSPEEKAEDDLFFSLFPAPVRERHTLFNVAAEDPLYSDEPVPGVRLGRFALRPSVDASWIHGNNLLLESAEPFVDDAYLVRARVNARLLESVHDVRLSYEARYRDYQDFDMEDRLTHFFDLSSDFEITPSTSARIGNHFVHGSFESQEFDFGGEVVGSTDPFYRNATEAVLSLGFSERFGAEVTGSYDTVEFREDATEFFDYDTRALEGTFLYDLSPVLSLTGAYVREVTPEPRDRPMAGSVADLFLVGLRGELTPMLRGEIRGGYSKERFEHASLPQNFSGFVAEASLTRDIGMESALIAFAGRRTSPSAFEQNGYYLSSYGRLQFNSPFAENFRLTLTGALFRNDYPVADADGIFRTDDLVSAGAGVAYFFNPLAFLSVDYRHDRRSSNIELFSYRSNAVQMMVGLGFLNR
jgi:hypothetical protein